MSDGESITETRRPTESDHDASDESGGAWDAEAARARLRSAERELRALLGAGGGGGAGGAPGGPGRRALRDLLPAGDGFLAHCRAALHALPPRPARALLCDVMSSIEDALRQLPGGAEGARAELCAFLCAACVADCPRVRNARPALRRLLPATSPEERVQLARLWWRALPAAALVQLSDAVRAPRPHAVHAAHAAHVPHGEHDAPSLAELLLRAALCRLPPHDTSDAEPQWELGAPRLEELEPVLEAWARQREHAARHDAARVMLCGRVLAVAPRALRPALLRRLDALRADERAAAAAAAAAAAPDRKVGVCKLQILFGADEKVHIHGKSRKPRPGRR